MSMAELRVALDIGSKKHRVGIGSADGRVLEEFEITHDKEGFERFFSRVAVFEKRLELPVVVAMEGLGGWARPLDRMIQQRGYELLNVNNVKLARFKEIFAAPAKTDKIARQENPGTDAHARGASACQAGPASRGSDSSGERAAQAVHAPPASAGR